MIADIEMSVELWLIGFVISMVVSTAGFVLLIVDLAKAIKEEKRVKR